MGLVDSAPTVTVVSPKPATLAIQPKVHVVLMPPEKQAGAKTLLAHVTQEVGASSTEAVEMRYAKFRRKTPRGLGVERKGI